MKFDYNNIGHGSYLISSNGYTWSHSKKEDNVVHKSFSFITGDVIYCEFDPEKKTLTLRKKDSTATSDKYTLHIEIPENDELHPCVNLCNANEQVELL
jgi:hypothetical protein